MPEIRHFKAPAEADHRYSELLKSIFAFRDCTIRLRNQLDQYPARLEAASRTNEFLDLSTGARLLLQARLLLNYCAENLASPNVPYILAAVDHFIDADGSRTSLEDLDGFDADLALFDEVIKHFALESIIPTSDNIRGAS